MWQAIYYILGFIVLSIVGIGIYVGNSMMTQLLNYLESKRDIRLTKKDVNLEVKMHRPDHLKKLMNMFRINEFRRVKRSERPESERSG